MTTMRQNATLSKTLTMPFMMLPVLLVTVSLALAGCNGAFIGNFFVLGVTIAIFFGTLSLGRTAEASRTARSTAGADSSRSVGPLSVDGAGGASEAAKSSRA